MLPSCSTRKLNTPSLMEEVKIQFYAQKHAAAPVEFTTSDDRRVLIDQGQLGSLKPCLSPLAEECLPGQARGTLGFSFGQDRDVDCKKLSRPWMWPPETENPLRHVTDHFALGWTRDFSEGSGSSGTVRDDCGFWGCRAGKTGSVDESWQNLWRKGPAAQILQLFLYKLIGPL